MPRLLYPYQMGDLFDDLAAQVGGDVEAVAAAAQKAAQDAVNQAAAAGTAAAAAAAEKAVALANQAAAAAGYSPPVYGPPKPLGIRGIGLYRPITSQPGAITMHIPRPWVGGNIGGSRGSTGATGDEMTTTTKVMIAGGAALGVALLAYAFA